MAVASSSFGDRAGVSNLFVADLARPDGEPRALTTFESGAPACALWSRDSQRVYFARGGDLWLVPAAGGPAEPVWTSPAPESAFALSPDNTRTAVVRPSSAPEGGVDLVTRSTSDGSEIIVAHDTVNIAAVVWSPDSAHLAYSAGARSIRHEQTPEDPARRSSTRSRNARRPRRLRAVSALEAGAVGAPGNAGRRWLDARRVGLDRVSPDYKRRAIAIADITTGAITAAHEDVDEKFWSMPGGGGGVGAAVTGRQVDHVPERS